MAQPKQDMTRPMGPDWHCPNCQAEVSDGMVRCWRCGSTPDGRRDPAFSIEPAQPGGTLYCSHCEYCLTGLNVNRCPECGQPFDPDRASTVSEVSPEQATNNRRTVQIWLASVIFIALVLTANSVQEEGLAVAIRFVSTVAVVLMLTAPVFVAVVLWRLWPRGK